MLNKLIVGLVLVVLLLSCSEKETPGGVTFTYLKKGDGEEVATGKYIMVHMIVRDFEDTILMNTYKSKRPKIMPMPDESLATDPTEFGVFKMLTKGDCVAFEIPAKVVYAKRRMTLPDTLSPDSPYKFIVQLKEVWTLEETKEYEKHEIEKAQRLQAMADSIALSTHLQELNIKYERTASGLCYLTHKKGTGEFAKTGKVAYVKYAGYSLDNKIFDTNIESVAKANQFPIRNTKPYPVAIGMGSVIDGWDEMLQRMNLGMKVTVYIPSGLAYGFQGQGNTIPPNAILKFDMELVDLK